MSEQSQPSRRAALARMGLWLNGVFGALLSVPLVAYLLSPLRRRSGAGGRQWVDLGPSSQFPEGETRLAAFRNPFVRPWDGQTAEIPCWVRHIERETFQVFAVNCAHLGCPVRWFAASGLFLCPCHGGVYYADGSRASGPPERGLFQYDYKVDNGRLVILAGQLPTLSTSASLRRRKPCEG